MYENCKLKKLKYFFRNFCLFGGNGRRDRFKICSFYNGVGSIPIINIYNHFMYIYKLKNNSNSTRHQVNIKKSLLCKNSNIVKSLIVGSKIYSGRGFNGKITIGHKGSGTKKAFRDLRFNLNKSLSLLITIFYDSKRSSFVSLFYDFLTLRFFNTLHTAKTFPGSILFSYKIYPDLRLGSLNKLKNIPTGSSVHSLYTKDFCSQYVKSAGTFGLIIQKDLEFCMIRMPSGAVKKFSVDTLCILGKISNNLNNKTILGKAGRSRLKNNRPHVRGVAMNPVDHPHGGQTSGGIPSVTPWGIPTKGKPTRKKNVKV